MHAATTVWHVQRLPSGTILVELSDGDCDYVLEIDRVSGGYEVEVETQSPAMASALLDSHDAQELESRRFESEIEALHSAIDVIRKVTNEEGMREHWRTIQFDLGPLRVGIGGHNDQELSSAADRLAAQLAPDMRLLFLERWRLWKQQIGRRN